MSEHTLKAVTRSVNRSRRGRPPSINQARTNLYVLLTIGSAALIPIGSGVYTIVDVEDLPVIGQSDLKRWMLKNGSHTSYAVSQLHQNGKYVTTVRMHRLIMKAPEGIEIDHRDRNGLNNRKRNLRFATDHQNAWNHRPTKNTTSRFKGVSWHKRDKAWRVSIRCHGKGIHLGDFHSETEAGLAYDRAALIYHGEFAFLNFPHEMAGVET